MTKSPLWRGKHAILGKFVLTGQRHVRLRNDEVLFVVGGQVIDLRRHPSETNGLIFTSPSTAFESFSNNSASRACAAAKITSPSALFISSRSDQHATELAANQASVVGRQRLIDPAIRRLDEAVGVDLAIRRQVADQTDVRPLRRLDRADAAIVRLVHVAHVESGALARQAAGAQRREAALVTDLGQRIRLIHELRELAAAEELLHRRDDRTDVDQLHSASPAPVPGCSCAP